MAGVLAGILDDGDPSGRASVLDLASGIQFVAEVLTHLARLYSTKGDLTNAQATYERALAMEEKILGRDHPTTVRSRAELAEILQRTKPTDFSR